MLLCLTEAVRRPLTEAPRRLMPETVERVAGKKYPAMIALTTVLLRWPDRHLAVEYVKGHSIVGHIQTSGVFRAGNGKQISKDELAHGFLGDEAIAFIDKMIARQPRKDSVDIERLMEAETTKGYQSEPVVKADMDRKYGTGSWRPMPLFTNEEAGGKQRFIANAKGGGHNEWTSGGETLFVIAVGFAADAALMVTDERARLHLPEETTTMTTQQLIKTMLDWIQLGLGCDDMTDAFRQSPVAPDHQGVNVVAIYAPSRGSWVFSEVYGLVYGMKSSVLHFQLLPGVVRRNAEKDGGSGRRILRGRLHGHRLPHGGGSGQAFANLVINTNGGALGPEKQKPKRTQQVMLGVNVRMDGILREGTVLFEPREETTHKVIEATGAILLKKNCTPAEAAKLRGVASWAAGNTFGRIGRLGLRTLKTRQYQKDANVELTEELLMGLRFLVEVMPEIGPRETRILGPTPRPTYRGVLRRLVAPVDDHGGGRREGRAAAPRLGHLQPRRAPARFFHGAGSRVPLCPFSPSALFPRKAQIMAAEAVAMLTALVLTPQPLANRELVRFIDNEPALSSLIRGGSKAEDVGHVAACTQLAMLEHSCAAWCEWIDSASNPADGFSRDGIKDKWTLEQGWEIQEIPPEAFQQVAEYMGQEKARRITGTVPLAHDFA